MSARPAPPAATAATATRPHSPPSLPSGVAAIVDRLDPEQRAAALVAAGPAQIIAPAGSGKTTTLIARLGVLLGTGVPADRICVVTFNRDAAMELLDRIERRLQPLAAEATRIEVRTLHALARQVLLDAGDPVRLVNDRGPLLRAARRRVLTDAGPEDPAPPEAAELDTILSAWKIEGRTPPDAARPVLERYQALLHARGGVDFDDLVVGACELLEQDLDLRRRWQARFSHVLVDEFQDVDAAQLRLVRCLAEPERNLFVVGDDDQTIYAWRLADVRRILDFSTSYPDAHRVMLATNYRCAPPVVHASRRLIAVNRERFVKRIEPAPAAHGGTIAWVDARGPDAVDRLALLAGEATAERRLCLLARTRSELIPVQLALLRAGIRHTTSLRGALDAEPTQSLLAILRERPAGNPPFRQLVALRAVRGWTRGQDALSDDDHVALDALLGWAAAFRQVAPFLAALDDARRRLEELRDPSAPVELVTVHGAKGREWHTVVIVGFEEDRMPNRRSLLDSRNPERAMEEERRLAYVAVTRAAQRLLLAFDPERPSPFLAEMGLGPAARRRTPPTAATPSQSPTSGATGVR